jgi:hypothetical protein
MCKLSNNSELFMSDLFAKYLEFGDRAVNPGKFQNRDLPV